MSKENVQELVKELSALLEKNVSEIRLQWINEMKQAGLLSALSPEEIEEQSKAIYGTCVLCLKTGSYEGAERYAANMARKGVLEAMTVDQIVTGLLILRDVYGRAIFQQYHTNTEKWRSIIGVYEPVARRILNIVALAFVSERESVIKQQQEAIMKLATPLVEVWEGVVMLPLIGTLDSARSKQLTESVLGYIAQTKTGIVVLDISGIAAVDTKAASHILRSIQAVKLMGADVVVTGIRPDVATTLVTLGIDFSGLATRSSLREGLEYAYDKLGLKVTRSSS